MNLLFIQPKYNLQMCSEQGFQCCTILKNQMCSIYYIPRRKSGIYWIQVRRAAAAAAATAVEISLWTR